MADSRRPILCHIMYYVQRQRTEIKPEAINREIHVDTLTQLPYL